MSFAYDCDNLSSDIGSGDAPSPLAMTCIVARVINLFLFSVGVAFVVIVGYGAIKGSLALGDPKGLTAARQTWTYGLVGFFVVVFFFAIFVIILNALGMPVLNPAALIERLQEGITDLLITGQVTGY